MLLFQSTLPHGERLYQGVNTLSTKKFQSTLPHGERLHDFVMNPILYGVSIHAPARGATCRTMSDIVKRYVSIHAPARGATVIDYSYGMREWFQSTLPHGERPAGSVTTDKAQLVSIHAPARGATISSTSRTRSPSVSIHAPARGATHLL